MKFCRSLFFLALSLLLSPAFCQGQDSQFADLDTDSNGKVSKKEFDNYARPKLGAFDEIDEFIDRVDADSDGVISEDEFDGRALVLRTLNEEMLDGEVKKKELSKEELKMVEEATKAYDEMDKLVLKGDWKGLAKGMTKQASDDYAINLVAQSLVLAKSEIPAQLNVAGVKAAKDATQAVVEKFKLDDIDVSSMLRNQGGKDPKSDDDSEDETMTPQEKAKARQAEAIAQQDKVKANIMSAIDKDDRRWEIVGALNEAQKGTPLSRNVFGGKTIGSDIKKNTVFLTVTRETTDDQIAVPAVIKMASEKGTWKYAGLDPIKTQREIQRMMQRLRQGRDVGPKTDF